MPRGGTTVRTLFAYQPRAYSLPWHRRYKQTRKEQQEEAKREALRPPDWMTATPPAGSPTLEWRASWLTLWLQDSGVNMDR